MGWNIKSKLSRCLRSLGRLLCYGILLSLPVTIFPIIWGVQGAVQFHFWRHRQIRENVDAMTFEMDQHSRHNYWNVPGAPTFHEFQDSKEPFFIPKLRLMDWVGKLSLVKPDQYPEEDPSIDRMANLDDLARRKPRYAGGPPTEYWVYVTWMPEYGRSPWNEAWNEIIQEGYARTPRPDVGFFYLDCLSSQFLCGIWGVKRPSLVHFKVANQTIAELRESEVEEYSAHTEHIYASMPENLLPVTARVIELPLKGDDAVHFLPRNTLPTPYLQLRTLIFGAPQSAIVEHFESWASFVQDLRRFNDHIDDLADRSGTYWFYLSKADKWYTDKFLKPIFGADVNDALLSDIQGFIFTCLWLITEIVRIPFMIGWGLYSWYFGLGWDGEPMGTHQWPQAEGNDPNAQQGNSMLDDMMAGFFEFAAQKMAAESVEAAASAAVTGDA